MDEGDSARSASFVESCVGEGIMLAALTQKKHPKLKKNQKGCKDRRETNQMIREDASTYLINIP
jgi:hypothetical protein